MPGVISVSDFVRETREDINSPTTSTFIHKIPQCRETVSKLEEALSADRESLSKLKSAVKEMHKTGNNHVNGELDFSKALNRLGDTLIMREDCPDYGSDDIGAAFQKFSVVTKELSNLMKTLVSDIANAFYSPLSHKGF